MSTRTLTDLDIEAVEQVIELDAGQSIPNLRRSLNDAKAMTERLKAQVKKLQATVKERDSTIEGLSTELRRTSGHFGMVDAQRRRIEHDEQRIKDIELQGRMYSCLADMLQTKECEKQYNLKIAAKTGRVNASEVRANNLAYWAKMFIATATLRQLTAKQIVRNGDFKEYLERQGATGLNIGRDAINAAFNVALSSQRTH